MNPLLSTANRDQIEYWNGPRGATWVAEQELRDRAIAVYGKEALKQARVARGERVVDIGCGCGATTLELATAVGPNGSVLGIDVSGPMLARARERAAGLSQIRFELADASTFAFDRRATLIYSRFGVMFFDDARAAFTNLRRALAPGGRLVFVCWRKVEENLWMSVPFAAAKTVVPPSGPPPPPDAPGPLSLADPNRVRAILEASGFRSVVLTPFDHPMPLCDGKGLDAATADAMSMGPASRLLTDAGDEARARAGVAIRAALAPYAKGDEVRLAAATWIVSAVAG